MSSLHKFFILLIGLYTSLSFSQIDVTYLLADLEFDLAIGNGCGQFGNEGYKVCYTSSAELNDHQLDIMWIELTVGQPITNNGIEVDVLDLLTSGQLELICPVSGDYINESTIIVLDETLSIPEVSDRQKVKIYPNPASDHLFIKGENLSNVTFYDLTGKKMFEIRNPTNFNKCYLLNYSSGIYILKCTFSNGHIVNEKIIIK